MKINFQSDVCQSSSPVINLCRSEDDSNFETLWSLGKDFGSGILSRVELRPGFNMYLCNYHVKESFITNFDYKKSAFGFNFGLSGSTEIVSSVIPSRFFKSVKCNSPIYYTPDQSGVVKDLKNSHRLFVCLMVEPEPLNYILQGTLDSLPSNFRSFLDGSSYGIFNHESNINPAISHILDQIFKCSYKGMTRRIFLESKALELIALRVEQMNSDRRVAYQFNSLDKEKIHHAAFCLSSDLENPPSLFELASSVGISHSKLNKGFKEFFGTTAFGYLRQERMKEAKRLLGEGMNVTESAFAVGYNSLSSFTRAFRGEYGRNPNSYIHK